MAPGVQPVTWDLPQIQEFDILEKVSDGDVESSAPKLDTWACGCSFAIDKSSSSDNPISRKRCELIADVGSVLQSP